jgi:tetratricopeptide (TPR) repeat protein
MLASASRVLVRPVILVVAVVAAFATVARGQVAAPRLIEEGEEAFDEAHPPARSPPARGTEKTTAAPPSGMHAAPAPAASAASAAGSQPDSGAGPEDSPAPPAAPSGASVPPGSQTAADLARRIVPVSATYASLMERWAERRKAQRESDPARAEHAGKALLAVRHELAIRNLVSLSAAEVREARRALASNLPGEAVAHAQFAVELAPSLPDAHLVLARARFAHAAGRPAPVLAAVRDAFLAALGEPHSVRAFWADVLGAALAAVVTAAVATVLLLVLRHVGLFLHDLHHLPLLRGTAPAQAGFLGVVLLGLPLALGPLPAVAVALLAVWLYLSNAERLVTAAALVALLSVPWAAGGGARLTAWTGTLAERVHEVENGALSDEEAAELAAAIADAPAPMPLYAALGRHHKRRGHLDEALRLYRLAAAADDRAPELQVNIGNVLFLQGDLEGAKAAYLAAADRAGTDLVVLGAAHYDLSKLYLRTSDMEKSAAARERAEREAGDFLREFGSDDDFSANRYLVDVPVPKRKIAALAAVDPGPDAIAGWIRSRLAGGLSRGAWPWAAAALLAVLCGAALLGSKLAPARQCERCGRAACRRCDAGAGALCGQCVNVFTRKGVVDVRDRLRKEAQVRRYVQFRQVATRILSIVAAGAAQIWDGAAVRGALLLVAILFSAFLVWFWPGIAPPPQPSAYVLAAKVAVAAPIGIALWALAIRDAFRRTQ